MKNSLRLHPLCFLGRSLVILWLTFTPFISAAATLTVTNGNDNGPGSLRNALATASNNDLIVFASNVSTVTLTSGELLIEKSVHINGGTSGVTITRSEPRLRKTASAQATTSTKSASVFTFKNERKVSIEPPPTGIGIGFMPDARRKRTGGLSMTRQPVESISTACHLLLHRSK